MTVGKAAREGNIRHLCDTIKKLSEKYSKIQNDQSRTRKINQSVGPTNSETGE